MKLTGSAKRMLAGIIFVIVTLLLIWRGWSAPDTGDKLFLGVGRLHFRRRELLGPRPAGQRRAA